MKLDLRNLEKIGGWLSRIDLEISKTILLGQKSITNADGAIVEIGVHHGKSFVALGTFSCNSHLYAIDIFDAQEGNIDQSGHGNKRIFLDNLDRFGIDRSRVVIDSRMSHDVRPDDILSSVGNARFFHIDGGHHYDAVKNDLELAVAVLSYEGVVAIDDLFRPEWPEVSMAVFGATAFSEADFVCFAIGFNKSFFCRSPMVEKYHALLRKERFLSPYLSKVYKPKNASILVYQRYPLPEWGLMTLASWALSVYQPNSFVTIYPALNRVKHTLMRIIGK